MTVASVNYEVATDSWWCALASSALLFGLLSRLMSGPGPDGRISGGRIPDARISGGRGA
jgi:hypothetical protein